MKRFLIASIIIVSLFFRIEAKAQSDTIKRYPHQKTIIKFSPLGLLEFPTTTIQFGVEYPINKSISMQHDLAFIPGYEGPFLWDQINHRYGWRVRTEIKFYLADHYITYLEEEGYISIDLFYRSRTFLEQGWRMMGGGSYQQFLEYDLLKTTGGIHFKYGRLKHIGSNFFTDYFIGFGFRFFKQKANLDESLPISDTDMWSDDYLFFSPSVTLGLKIGFGF